MITNISFSAIFFFPLPLLVADVGHDIHSLFPHRGANATVGCEPASRATKIYNLQWLKDDRKIVEVSLACLPFSTGSQAKFPISSSSPSPLDRKPAHHRVAGRRPCLLRTGNGGAADETCQLRRHRRLSVRGEQQARKWNDAAGRAG